MKVRKNLLKTPKNSDNRCYQIHGNKKWAASSEFSTYRPCEQRRFRRACAVSPEPPLFAHTSRESRETFKQKARSLAPLNGWACAVKISHDRMLEDTNSLDASQEFNSHIDVLCDSTKLPRLAANTTFIIRMLEIVILLIYINDCYILL